MPLPGFKTRKLRTLADILRALVNPSVRYFTLRWILDLPEENPQVCAAQEAVSQSAPVQKIFRQMHPAGYWGSDPEAHAGCRVRHRG